MSSALSAAPDSNTKFMNIYAGAYVSGKVGLNTKVADGFKSDVSFNSVPDFGATVLLAFGKRNNIGIGLDLGYSTDSYISKPDDFIRNGPTDLNTIKEQYHYLGLFPHLYFSGFVVGVNIGLPSSATTRSKTGHDVSVRDQGGPSDPPLAIPAMDYTDSLATIFEIKLGGRLPVSDDPLGRLNIEVMATYSLTHLYKYAGFYYGAYSNDGVSNKHNLNSDYNPLPVTLSLGISYQFCLAIEIGH
jgi:hypothetical protein